MIEHDPQPASDPPPRLDADARPVTRPVSPARTVEEARRPALALLDRLHEANAITLAELSRGRSAILGGELDELLVPVGAEAPTPIAGSAQGAQPVRRSIGDYFRQRGVLS